MKGQLPYATSRALLATGLVLFPAFILQHDLVLRAAQILFFTGLNALTGRRARLVQFLVMTTGIVFFNLVIPTGKVLVAVFGFPLTEGALKSGLFKATAMIGLIALSQFAVRSELRLPGVIGGLVGRSFFYFEKIMGAQRRIDRKDIIGSIDRILVEVQGAGAAGTRHASHPRRSTFAGILVLAAIVIVNWGALAFTIVHPLPFWGG
jgi:hypothetical protein